jgi:hypothetical protein
VDVLEPESEMPHQATPPLYLEILALVASLEHAGKRSQAERARERARTLYAAGWDAACVRRLELVRAELRKALQ